MSRDVHSRLVRAQSPEELSSENRTPGWVQAHTGNEEANR